MKSFAAPALQKQPWPLRIYLRLARWLAPVWRRALQRRLARGKETPRSLAQKQGLAYDMRPAGRLVWGHAVGVGEAQALAGLFARLAEQWPADVHFLITTTARTSADALRASGLPPRCQHQFAPIDTPRAVACFLDHWQPALAIWCEMDLWPALIAGVDSRGIARLLVNARLSAPSLARRRLGRALYRALLPGFAALFAQNQASAEALAALGAPPERVKVTGTIKALAPALGCDAQNLALWQQALGERPVWLAASTHPGEEALALQAHALLRQQQPDALLIIAPRMPARGAAVAALCPPGTPLRSAESQSHPLGPGPAQAKPLPAAVYVADTIGEMGLWYRLAPVALVGGSIAPVGGHNPHEPLALGCAVLHGPQVGNFSESYADLDAQGLSQGVTDAAQTAAAVARIWQEGTAQQAAATRPATGHRAAMQEMIEQIVARLPPPQP